MRNLMKKFVAGMAIDALYLVIGIIVAYYLKITIFGQ